MDASSFWTVIGTGSPVVGLAALLPLSPYRERQRKSALDWQSAKNEKESVEFHFALANLRLGHEDVAVEQVTKVDVDLKTLDAGAARAAAEEDIRLYSIVVRTVVMSFVLCGIALLLACIALGTADQPPRIVAIVMLMVAVALVIVPPVADWSRDRRLRRRLRPLLETVTQARSAMKPLIERTNPDPGL